MIDAVIDQYREYATLLNTSMEDLTKLTRENKPLPSIGWLKTSSLLAQEVVGRIGQVFAIVYCAMYNMTAGWVTGQRKAYPWRQAPLNTKKVLEMVVQVHGYEILINGIFNGWFALL